MKKLLTLFKKKIGELLGQTQIKIIISFEELLEEWEITDVHTEELKNVKGSQPKRIVKENSRIIIWKNQHRMCYHNT